MDVNVKETAASAAENQDGKGSTIICRVMIVEAL